MKKYLTRVDVTHVQLFSGDYETQWAHAKSVLEGNDRCAVVDDWILNWKCVIPHQVVPVLMNIMYKLPCVVGHSFNLTDISKISREPFRVVKRCLENSSRIVDRVQNALNFRDLRRGRSLIFRIYLRISTYFPSYRRLRRTLPLPRRNAHGVHNMGHPPSHLRLHSPSNTQREQRYIRDGTLLSISPSHPRRNHTPSPIKAPLRTIHILHDGA